MLHLVLIFINVIGLDSYQFVWRTGTVFFFIAKVKLDKSSFNVLKIFRKYVFSTFERRDRTTVKYGRLDVALVTVILRKFHLQPE